MSKKQAEARYSKEHSEDERIAKRGKEYLASKIETAISMLRRSIMEGGYASTIFLWTAGSPALNS